MDKTEMCMEADDIIWSELGIMCGQSSDPNTKTTENSWDEYVEEVKAWVDSNGVGGWPEDVLHNVYAGLEAENYHSFREAMMGIINYGTEES